MPTALIEATSSASGSESERKYGILGRVRARMALGRAGRRSLLVLGDLGGHLEVAGQRRRQHRASALAACTRLRPWSLAR